MHFSTKVSSSQPSLDFSSGFSKVFLLLVTATCP